MTTHATPFHCRALRCAQQTLRGLPLRALAAGLGAVAVLTLAPVELGFATARPIPVIRAAAARAGDEFAADVDGDTTDMPRVDPVLTVAAALGACPNALSPAQRWSIARIINRVSEQHGYDPLFILALVQVESGCLPTARGGDALGLVQLLPSTARDVARRAGVPWRGERTLTEPSSSIQLGVRYLIELEDQLGGDAFRAVAAYNLGPARVAHMSSWRAQRTLYVRKILLRYEQLLDEYA